MNQYADAAVLVVLVLLIAIQFRKNRDFKKMIEASLDPAECVGKSTKKIRIQYGIASICVGGAILLFAFYRNMSYILLLAVIATLFLTKAMNDEMNACLYVTKHGFFLQKGYIKDKSVSRITKEAGKPKQLVLTNGTTYPVTDTQAEEIKKRMEKRK